jgi:NAD(P)-dependent dehydrogenase (short-subunit alcohol dehydrogenase family)
MAPIAAGRDERFALFWRWLSCRYFWRNRWPGKRFRGRSCSRFRLCFGLCGSTNRNLLTDEASIQLAADFVLADTAPDLVLVTTGVLHADTLQPEKTIRGLTASSMAQSFAINAIGPALIAKHFAVRLPRDRRALFAALSARVGSISDNYKGGWHSYRTSKAALNQIIRTTALELALRHPLAVCVGLHPGTVDTLMSKPFQSGVPTKQLFSADQSVAHLLTVIDALTPKNSGRIYAWDGQEIPA